MPGGGPAPVENKGGFRPIASARAAFMPDAASFDRFAVIATANEARPEALRRQRSRPLAVDVRGGQGRVAMTGRGHRTGWDFWRRTSVSGPSSVTPVNEFGGLWAASNGPFDFKQYSTAPFKFG